MIGKIAVTIALMVATSAIAQAGSITITGDAKVNGQVYLQMLDDEALAKQPAWDLETKPCPLDPGKAAQLAVQVLKKTFPSTNHLKLDSIGLHSVEDMKGKWYYWVSFYGRRASGERDSANVIVCFDGTVPKFVFERKE